MDKHVGPKNIAPPHPMQMPTQKINAVQRPAHKGVALSYPAGISKSDDAITASMMKGSAKLIMRAKSIGAILIAWSTVYHRGTPAAHGGPNFPCSPSRASPSMGTARHNGCSEIPK